jgi:hypothetical protein
LIVRTLRTLSTEIIRSVPKTIKSCASRPSRTLRRPASHRNRTYPHLLLRSRLALAQL